MSATKLISILGAGHSGSTLLDLVLGNHSKIQSVGEITHWDQYFQQKKNCSCGFPPQSCEFWHPIVEQWYQYLASMQSDETTITDTHSRSLGATSRFRYRTCLGLTLLFPMYKWPRVENMLLPEFQQRATNIIKLFDLVRQVSDKPIVCDSSKSTYRYRILHARQPAISKAIYLTRDGRAVAASHFKRNGEPVRVRARRWRFANNYTQNLLRTLPRESYIHVRYEELCREPEKTLSRICDFLGYPFEEEMMKFTGKTLHNIGGNRMRMSGLFDIQEDLKWRETLSSKQLIEFDRIAGKTNNRLLGRYKLQ